jgi:glycosyltransferase involved in cell wall biosynthesis
MRSGLLRIAWFSNSPDVPTGYGVQTLQVARRMAADGHEVHILGNYGHRSGIRMVGGLTVWPEGIENYSLDIATELARMVDAEVVFTLYDVWVMKNEWPDRRVISWTPVDHYPPPPDVLRWARAHETIAMSEFGAAQFRENGIEPVAMIHHGVEPVYHPTESDARQRAGIPDDAFVVMVNAANIGSTPPRKAWGENIQALAAFLHRHDDAFVYLHTDLARPSGVPLPVLIEALQIPRERVKVAPPFLYRAGLLDDDYMAQVYSAADVLLATSKGEGFGVPVIEAMACGTPAIVSDFTAQPELVGDTGWKVPGQLDWDWNQGAFFFTPRVDAIVASLEDAYSHRGDRSAACVERAEMFSAQTLYEKHWRPLLASLPQRVRPGNTKAAKRRKKGAR